MRKRFRTEVDIDAAEWPDLLEPADPEAARQELVDLDALASRMAEHLAASVLNAVAAGRIYVEMLDRFGDTGREKAQAAAPGIPDAMWNRLESVGRGQMHHRLLFATYPAAGYIARLPLDEQTQALDMGVELRAGDVVRVIPAEKMTKNECRMVFGAHNAPPGRQTLRRTDGFTPRMPYVIAGGVLRVQLVGVTFTAAELEGILAEMKR